MGKLGNSFLRQVDNARVIHHEHFCSGLFNRSFIIFDEVLNDLVICRLKNLKQAISSSRGVQVRQPSVNLPESGRQSSDQRQIAPLRTTFTTPAVIGRASCPG